MATIRQRMLRFLYPVIRILGKGGKNGAVLRNTTSAAPARPAYDLQIVLNNGRQLGLNELSGRKILLVNTASDCGYTGQYAELQRLQARFENKLLVIGFPSNDFKDQEQGADAQIAQFCQLNYGVTFPIARKTVVRKGAGQSAVFEWLTDSAQNGWNEHAPDWNFSKYLIDETGRLTHYFGPSISPLGKEVVEAVSG